MTTENDGRKSNRPIGNAAAPDVTGNAPGGYNGYNQTMPTLRHRRQEAGQRRAAARVNAAVFAGYVVTATTAVALKAWETIRACDPDGWLGTTNVVIWDAITLYGALGALALGVREMVLAYFMRKDYEAEIDTLLRNQEAQAEIAKAQAESIREMREMQTERRLEAETVRDAEIARRKEAEAIRDAEIAKRAEAEAGREAANRQLQEQNALIREMLEIITQQRNGNGNGSSPAPSAGPEPPDQPEE